MPWPRLIVYKLKLITKSALSPLSTLRDFSLENALARSSLRVIA